jgi:hypothetical protein
MVDRWNRIPDGIEPIVAYRAWNFNVAGGRAELSPITHPGDQWDGATLRWVTASCHRVTNPWHVAPMEECTCGFYAWRTLNPMIVGMAGSSAVAAATADRTGIVLGRVEFAGKVIEHELGYRAERARIAELIPIRGSELLTTILAKRLGVSVADPVDVPTPDEFLTQFIRQQVSATQFIRQQVSAQPVPRVEPKTPPREPEWSPLCVAVICLVNVLILIGTHVDSPSGAWEVGPALIRTTIFLAVYAWWREETHASS